MSLTEEDRYVPNRPSWREWDDHGLLSIRDVHQAWLRRAAERGWDPEPVPLVLASIERELDRRRAR